MLKMDFSLDLILKHPLINIKNTQETDIIKFEGKLFVNLKDYLISLQQITQLDGQQNYKLDHLSQISKELFQEIQELLKKRNFQNVLQVLDFIQEKLELKCLSKQVVNNCGIYRKVLDEYNEFTKFFLTLNTCKLRGDLTGIFISFSDTKSRIHQIEVSIDYSKNSNGKIFNISKFDLPQNNNTNFSSNESLITLFDKFIATVELLQSYFDLMEEFDKNATILDPENPKWKDTFRTIWLGTNISTIIYIDPFNIFERPNIKFLGPESLVESYNSRLSVINWSVEENIFEAILDLLGLQQFPKKAMLNNQLELMVDTADGEECCICSSFRLNNKLPDIICKNPSCERFYHNECLYEWLTSLNNAVRIFKNITGNCPNCEKSISCPMLN